MTGLEPESLGRLSNPTRPRGVWWDTPARRVRPGISQATAVPADRGNHWACPWGVLNTAALDPESLRPLSPPTRPRAAKTLVRHARASFGATRPRGGLGGSFGWTRPRGVWCDTPARTKNRLSHTPPAPQPGSPAHGEHPRPSQPMRAVAPSRLVAVSTFVENPIQISFRQIVLVTPSAGWRGAPHGDPPGLVRRGPVGPEA